MAIYDIPVNSMYPPANSTINPTQTFSYIIRGDSVWQYGIDFFALNTALNIAGTQYVSSWNKVYQYTSAYGSKPYDDDSVVVFSGKTIPTTNVGSRMGYRAWCAGQKLVFTYDNTIAGNNCFYITYSSGDYPIQNGDRIRLHKYDFSTIYVTPAFAHVYGNPNGYNGIKSYIKLYLNKEDALVDSGQNLWPVGAFTLGQLFGINNYVQTSILPFNLVDSVPTITLDTTYADQTLTFNSTENDYTCINSSINLHFSLSGINSIITRYRVLLYSAQYGSSSGMTPTYTGEWIYNQDMYYQVEGQVTGSSLYIAVEAYDNLGVYYHTLKQQVSSGQYQWALAINFSYSTYAPTQAISARVTYDCPNGRDIVNFENISILYGQVNNGTAIGTSDYTTVNNFLTTGNNAIQITAADAYLYYPAMTSTGEIIYYIPPTGADCYPMFLWQTPSATFSNGDLFYFKLKNDNSDTPTYMDVSLVNNHIIRTTNAGGFIVGTETVDDGTFYPDENVIYLVAITPTRVIFRPYIYGLHNKLNFGLVAGQNVL
jgi:hypothetical protein